MRADSMRKDRACMQNGWLEREEAGMMGEAIGAVVFGLIGIAVLGALVYVLGFMLSIPVSLVYNLVKGVHLPEHPGHTGRVALHH